MQEQWEKIALLRPFLEKKLIELNQKIPPLVLLFDGLDSVFGNEEKDRETRTRSLTGLFSVLTEWEKRLSNMYFKIMLREDIWTRLRFENKSHLYGRTAVLKWSDQAQFLKVILNFLFERALDWESEAQKKNPYPRSVIRPRALMEQLPDVSRRALNSLLEEFPELDALERKLSKIGSTPFASEILDEPDITPSLELAREVGLLRVHEETDGNVMRYTIPELYRWGLNMGRKGPV